MDKPNALLIGESTELMRCLPNLLSRSKFNIDVITTNNALKDTKFIRNYSIATNVSSIPQKADEIDLNIYELIVVCDDRTLKFIAESNLTIEKKLQLLPVISEKDFKHIYSKIGLSQVLSEASITTPPFSIARNIQQAIAASEKLEYPVMIKSDSEGGGHEVFECFNSSDIAAIDSKIFDLPILVQKKIEGVELDLTAFYRNSQLIHFSYSKIEKVIKKFGPSCLRTYTQLENVDESIFLEMNKLGKALGANGFVCISCIKSNHDNKIYFFEADMRPNVWIDHTKFFGDDLAVKISKWFSDKSTLEYPFPSNSKYPTQLLIPYFLRMSLLEVIFNRYQVWKFMSKEDVEWLLQVQYRKMLETIRLFFKKINRIPTILIRLLIPEKDVRLRIKGLIRKMATSF